MAQLLVIDDDPVIRTLLSDYLSSHNHDVACEQTAQSGIEALARKHFDLLLLDFQMPDASGTEVLQQLQSRSVNKDLKVIMFSANNDTKKIVEAAGLTANLFLTKPFELHDLLQEINSLL